MLPRSMARSIIHIEELASSCSSSSSTQAIATTTAAATRSEAPLTNSSKTKRITSPDSSNHNLNLVGLQLLMAQRCSSSEQASAHLVTRHGIKTQVSNSSIAMLPRSMARSIFHIEELASSCRSSSSSSSTQAIATTTAAATRSEAPLTNSSKTKRVTSPDSSNHNLNLVGLQLLIAQRCSSSEQASAHLVTGHGIKTQCATAPPRLGFFRTCHLCDKELRPHMDVYVYRGEQGFCSAECRQHQMLVEERRESEAMLRRKAPALFQKPRRAANFKSKNTIRRWNGKSMIQAVA